MDDTDKTQGQAGQVPNQQPPIRGVGTLVKERELPVTSSADPNVSEFIEPSVPEVEPTVHEELEKIGVRTISEFPKVGPEEEKVGIKPAGASVPVKTEPSGLVQIPTTEEEIKQELKYEKPTNSNWGRLALLIKFFKKMHHKLLTGKN